VDKLKWIFDLILVLNLLKIKFIYFMLVLYEALNFDKLYKTCGSTRATSLRGLPEEKTSL